MNPKQIRKAKGLLLILAGSMAFLAALFITIASPLLKFLVERDAVKYTGRRILIEDAYVNPFTGFVRFSNLTIYECEKDTIFFSANYVTADFAMLKLFSHTVEITQLIVDHPRGTVSNKGKHFNFDDLVIRFSPDTLSAGRSRVHVNVLHTSIAHGEFYYHERVIPINYRFMDVNMESSGRRWDSDSISSTFSFLSQNEKGGMKGDFMINTKNLDYRFNTAIRNFDLEIIRQYLWELINYGMFSARLDATLNITGNFQSPDQIHTKGRLALQDFHLGKTIRYDYAGFKKLVLVMKDVSPANQKFLFDSVVLSRPVLRYEKYDSLNNLERLFGKAGSNITDITDAPGKFNLVIEIARYLKQLTRNFFQSTYNINYLAITQANLEFNDFSLSDQFSISAKPLTIRADSISKDNRRVRFKITSGVKPYGDLAIDLSINPRDSGDFDMGYHLNRIPASVFNPYLLSYTSFPVDRGTIELNGIWNVRNGTIKSTNHLIVIDPRISRRIKNREFHWIPLPFVMSFVRERANVIDYEIPISGNLKNPTFHLHDVVIDLLKNIFVKPVTIPYGITVRSTENKIENAIHLKWEIRQRELLPFQAAFVESMATFLDKNKTSTIDVHSLNYSIKEKEEILFFAAKKKYFISTHAKNKTFTRQDSLEVNKMSIKEPGFMHALKRGTGAGDTLMFTIQDKCMAYVEKGLVNSTYRDLVNERNRVFREYFVSNGTTKRLVIHSADTIPYGGFSNYSIQYKGDLPLSLKIAYDEMSRLDGEAPRIKYEMERKSQALK